MEEKVIESHIAKFPQFEGSHYYKESDRDPLNDSRSAVIKDLCEALSKAQAEMQTAFMDQTNNYFKRRYEDLVAVVNASRPALTKYGLSVVQQILPTQDGNSILHTILMHESGQWIESRMRIIPPKTDIQTLTSYIACLKRIAYASLIGVVAADEDDDGEVAMIEAREIYARGKSSKFNPQKAGYEVITKEQLEELEYELSDAIMADYLDDILDHYRIQSLADLPKSEYHKAKQRLLEIKNKRKT